LTRLTVVRSKAYQATVRELPVQLEHIEEVRTLDAYSATAIVNTIPDEPYLRGSYQYASYACAPDHGCVSYYMDYQYQDEELVEQAGTVCRFHARRFYDIVPWIDVMGIPIILDALKPYLGNLPGPLSVDGPWLPCAQVEQAHPAGRPFTTTPDGQIYPAPGWRLR
jgi:hypothetical protein